MPIPSVSGLVPILQIAVGPVILISGVGLLLLSMTNRLGRVIDRVRALCREIRGAAGNERRCILEQLEVLERRADLLRQAIIWGSVSVLLVALLIITLFLAAMLRLDAGWLVVVLFSGCLVTLIVSLLAFIGDINQSLFALKRELREVDSDPGVEE